MKKGMMAALMAAAMVAAMGTAAFATDVEPEFDPNPDYDKYTVVEYTIEDIGADLVCTVSATEDDTEFNIQCNFYGDDQDWTGTYDGSATTMIADKTGFMDGDAANIIAAALEQTDWVAIGGEAVDAEAETESADGEIVDWDVEPEFDPNEDYDVYTVLEYTIEDIGADLVCTVSADEDLTSFNIQCNFYGDDQDWTGTYDGEETTMEADKTGFMDGDAANIIANAIEQAIWAYIGDDVLVDGEEAVDFEVETETEA